MRGSAVAHQLLGATPRWSALKILRVDGSKWMTLQGGRRFLSTTTRGGRSSHAESLFAVTTGTARPSAPSILHLSGSSLVCSVRCHQRRLVLSSSSCGAGRFASRTFAFQSRPYVATDGDAPKSEENAEATTDPLIQREEKVPKTAIVLGVAGLIPLVAASAVVLTQSPHLAAQAMILQLNYAANLLSFMGAIHWGLAMADYRDPLLLSAASSNKRNLLRYGLSIMPCVIGWAATCSTTFYGLGEVMFGFTAVFLGDAVAARYGLVPRWYMRLRTPLTLAVTLALGVSWMYA